MCKEYSERFAQFDRLIKDQENQKAIELLNTLSHAGSSYYWRVGMIYEYGYGVKIDYQVAIVNYEKAVNLNDTRWLSDIAILYRKEKNFLKSVEFLKKGTEFDQLESFFLLGNYHEFGKSMMINKKKALYYYHKAAKKGHIFSKAIIIKHMIKGRLGKLKIVCGILLFPVFFLQFLFYFIFNPQSDRFGGLD